MISLLNETIDWLVKLLAKTGLLKKDLDYNLLRASMVIEGSPQVQVSRSADVLGSGFGNRRSALKGTMSSSGLAVD